MRIDDLTEECLGLNPYALPIALEAKPQYPTRQAARALCRQIEATAIVLDASILPTLKFEDATKILTELYQTAQLFAYVVILDKADVAFKSDVPLSIALSQTLERYACATLLLCEKSSRLSDRINSLLSLRFRIDLQEEDIHKQLLECVRFWEDAIRYYGLNPLEPEICAINYPYFPQNIRQIAHATRWLQPDESQFLPKDLANALEHQISAPLSLNEDVPQMLKGAVKPEG